MNNSLSGICKQQSSPLVHEKKAVFKCDICSKEFPKKVRLRCMSNLFIMKISHLNVILVPHTLDKNSELFKFGWHEMGYVPLLSNSYFEKIYLLNSLWIYTWMD